MAASRERGPEGPAPAQTGRDAAARQDQQEGVDGQHLAEPEVEGRGRGHRQERERQAHHEDRGPAADGPVRGGRRATKDRRQPERRQDERREGGLERERRREVVPPPPIGELSRQVGDARGEARVRHRVDETETPGIRQKPPVDGAVEQGERPGCGRREPRLDGARRQADVEVRRGGRAEAIGRPQRAPRREPHERHERDGGRQAPRARRELAASGRRATARDPSPARRRGAGPPPRGGARSTSWRAPGRGRSRRRGTSPLASARALATARRRRRP